MKSGVIYNFQSALYVLWWDNMLRKESVKARIHFLKNQMAPERNKSNSKEKIILHERKESYLNIAAQG